MSGAIETPAVSKISPLAGKPAPKEMLIDVAELEREYFERRPDLSDPNQMVSFGTSGHRGSPLHGTFTEAHILAITQAICEYRQGAGHRWPALHGQGHARGVRPGPAHRAGSAGGQRRGDHHPARRRRHADAGHLAGHPRLQPRPQAASRGRHRDHAVAQSAGGWRLQVQPDQRRTRRHRCDALGAGPRQRAAQGQQRRREARAVRDGDQGGHHASGGFCPSLRARPAERDRYGSDSRRRTQTGRRSAGRRVAALLGTDQRGYTGWTSRS